MSEILLVILVLGFGLAALVYARKLGAKSAELKLEKERKINEFLEKKRANRIIDNVRNYNADDIDRRLLYIKNNKR